MHTYTKPDESSEQKMREKKKKKTGMIKPDNHNNPLVTEQQSGTLGAKESHDR